MEAPARGRRLRIIGTVVLLLVAGFSLFARLGHYAPWDDEATTAMHGQAVWSRGEAYIARGHNIVAYQNGILAKNGINMADPPLQFFLAAPFAGIGGNSMFAARLPFALCGLATIALVLYWLHRDCDDPVLFTLFLIAFATSTALWLYFRQARYYAPAIFLSTLCAFLYLHYDRRSKLVALGIAMALLLLTHYVLYIAVCACILLDYVLWQRRRTPLKILDWIVMLAPQIVAAGWILIFRFPPASATAASHQGTNSIVQKLILFGYTLRDMNTDELMPVILLPVAILLALRNEATWLRRAVICLLAYVLVIAAIVPTSVAKSSQAETRYLAPVSPLCLAIVVLVLREIWKRAPIAATVLAVMAFGTTLLQLLVPARSTNLFPTPMRSTIASFVAELANPPGDPFSEAASWIDANVSPGESVVVFPLHMQYPLMFLQPKAVYAWQLSPEIPPPLPDLPEVHFRGREPPNYAIFFGRHPEMTAGVDPQLRQLADYEVAATLPICANVNFRPEISWRQFRAAKFDSETESIVIWRIKRPG